MVTDLGKIYISRIISMKFMDRITGEVLEEQDFEKCKDLNIEAEVSLKPVNMEKSELVKIMEGE